MGSWLQVVREVTDNWYRLSNAFAPGRAMHEVSQNILVQKHSVMSRHNDQERQINALLVFRVSENSGLMSVV